jgi:hypothetical protein
MRGTLWQAARRLVRALLAALLDAGLLAASQSVGGCRRGWG